MLILGAGLCQAAPPPDALLHLTGLGNAHLYVDGREVEVMDGSIHLPPGQHEVQAERIQSGVVHASRREVRLEAGWERWLTLKFAPVVAPGKAIALPGPRGPMGPPAPPETGGPPVPPNPKLEEIRRPLAATLDVRLSIFEANLRDARPGSAPPFFWCDPTGVVEVRGRSTIRGPAGPPGQRPEPLVATVLKDARGRQLDERCEEAIGLLALRQRWRPSAPDLTTPPVTPVQRIQRWRITLHTPDLRKQVEAEQEDALKSGREITSLPGPPGPPGPQPTCRGLGSAELLKERIIPDAQVNQLLAGFAADEAYRRRVKILTANIEELEREASAR